MPNSNKKTKKNSKKGLNKKKTQKANGEELTSLIANRLISTILNLEEMDYEDPLPEENWDDEEEMDISLLTPKEIIEILNSQGGDFTLSEGKTIKKFITFIESISDDDFEEYNDLDELDVLNTMSDINEKKENTEAKKEKTIKKLKGGKKEKIVNQENKSEKSESKIEEVYIIETKFGKATRTIAINSEQTLDELHLAIQKYYNWDNDHLYAFYMDNKPYSKNNCYSHPMSNEPPYANKIKMKELSLRKNKQFLYLFDFGEDNMFSLKYVEKKATVDFDTPEFPVLISKKGKNPRQYDYY